MVCPVGNVSMVANDDPLQTLVSKCVALAVLLVVLIGGNALVLVRMPRRCRKWSPCDRLVRTLAAIGILNGLLNVSTYLVTTITGRTMCHFCVIRVVQQTLRVHSKGMF